MKIDVMWDSGPYGIYLRNDGVVNHGEQAEVPDEVFARYERAQEELRNAEEALEAAIRGAK